MASVTVYGLASSKDDIIRYIGQTIQKPSARLGNHISRAMRGAGGARYIWIRETIKAGHAINALTIQSNADWNDSEVFWIESFRDAGCPLLNVAQGGASHYGHTLDDDTKARLSTITKALWTDPKFRAKVLAGHQRYWTPDRRKAQADRVTGSKQSEQHKKNISAGQIRRYSDPSEVRDQSVRLAKIRTGEFEKKRLVNLSAAMSCPEHRKATSSKMKETWRLRRAGLLPMPNHKRSEAQC